MPHLQIVNLNLAVEKVVFKKPIVCDISPNIAVQVINVAAMTEQALGDSVRALTAWDMSNAISQKEIASKSK
jgi:hypothetical protein